MTRRTVNLIVSEKFQDTVNGLNVPRQEIDRAVGYLTMWAVDGYDTLDLCLEDTGWMSAFYINKSTGRQFQMGAVLRGEGETASYSFHS